MTTKQNNEIFTCIARAMMHKNDYRCVVDFENGDTMLVDFSNCGEPFTIDETVCIWSLQRDTHDADGKWNGIEELDYGSFIQYSEVYSFVHRTLTNNPGSIYVESF